MSTMTGISQHIAIQVFENGEEAAREGFVYRRPDYKPVEIKKAIVVKEGTQGGNSTVDIVMQDENGKKFVTIISANLLRGIIAVCKPSA